MGRAHISQLRRMAAVRSIARAWRAAASNRTLLACSGGADSSALAIALAAALPAADRARHIVIAHVVHDLRPPAAAQVDADLARDLAAFLGVRFVFAHVHPAQCASTQPRRNLEALARRERYAALETLARDNECDAIATAHHADDQAETVLMRLLRGTGIDGLRAIHPIATRTLGPHATPQRILRPMLGVTRADAEQVCAAAGWQWGIDHTNMDTSRTRAWIRHEVLPILEARAPGASRRLAGLAAHAQSAHDALRRHARELWRVARAPDENPDENPAESIVEDPAAITFDRAALRAAPAHITSMVLRRAVRRAGAGRRMDRISAHTLADAVAIVHDRVGGARQIRLAGASLLITRDRVRVSQASSGQESPSLASLPSPPAPPPASLIQPPKEST